MARQCWSALSISTVKSQTISFLKIKQGKFLNGYTTYQSHMSISVFKSSTYVCLWPIEFCQIVVTLGRIFSCFLCRDHIHPHIHDNSYTGSYTKHAIHPSKINTPTTVTTTNHRSCEMTVSLGPQRTLVTKSASCPLIILVIMTNTICGI
jgi:hypothetical protein